MLCPTRTEGKLDFRPDCCPTMEDAMMMISMIPRALLALVTSVGFAGAIGAPAAPERASISGVAQMKYSVQHALPREQNASPVLLLDEAAGTNRNTGSTDYMQGASVINREIANLVQGNGPHSGYITLARGSDTTVSQWQGNVVTTPGANGQPSTRFEGKWTMMRGTGKYAGITGSGTYEGQILSQSAYTLTWKGDIEVNQRASR
jgi:hypothetical protein